MNNTISVIVPVYNCRDYLRECIDSIIAQTYQNIQLILTDDGSTDGSSLICDEYAQRDSRITVIHQANLGVSAARNAGMQVATGDYLVFADSDDILRKDALETAFKYITENNTDAVLFGWRTADENSAGKDIVFPCEVSSDTRNILRHILTDYSAYGGGYPWNKMWRVAAFGKEIPQFDTQLYYFEDLEWVVRMMLRIHSIAVCPECLYTYRILRTSISRSREKAEHRELGYHRSVAQIIRNLDGNPELQTWFSEKYYPEIVNGVLHSLKFRFRRLRKHLLFQLKKHSRDILCSTSISQKTKLRCRCLLLLHKLHFI